MTKTILHIVFAVFAATCAISASAQEYPTKPLRIIVPFSPGGGADNSARILAEPLGARLGQSVIVENRPGAAGNIGTALVAQAAPDGYTLLLGFDGTMVINPHVFSKLPFDTLRDFAPVTKLGDLAVTIAAHPSMPPKNLAQFIAFAKKSKATFHYGSTGVGSTLHLLGELLKQRTGIALEHVSYKGGAQAMTDVIAGHIPLVSTSVSTVQPHVKAGKLLALGVASASRSPALPDVPTFIESGLPGFEVTAWNGILVPAKTPRPVVEKLHREIVAVLRMPQVRERYAAFGTEVVGNTQEQFAEQIKRDLVRWEKVVKTAGIRLE